MLHTAWRRPDPESHQTALPVALGQGVAPCPPTGVNIPPPLPGSASDLQTDIKKQARCGTATDGRAQLSLCSPSPDPALLLDAPPGWS